MQVRAGGHAGIAHFAKRSARSDPLADSHVHSAHVGVDGEQRLAAIAEIDFPLKKQFRMVLVMTQTGNSKVLIT